MELCDAEIVNLVIGKEKEMYPINMWLIEAKILHDVGCGWRPEEIVPADG